MSAITIAIISTSNMTNVTTPVTAAPLCLPAPRLSNTPDGSWVPKAGVSVSTWNFARGVSHNGPEATRVSVSTASLNDFDLLPMHDGFPNVSDPYALIRDNNVYAAVNTDFFDLSWPAFAWGPVVKNGVAEYLPFEYEGNAWKPTWLKVVGTVDDIPPAGDGYLTTGSLQSQWANLSLGGTNLANIPNNSAIVYDKFFTGSTPKGEATLVVQNGVVTEIFSSGKSLTVPNGVKVIQATGNAAKNLRKFAVKPVAKLQIDGPITKGFSARGVITNNTKKIPIVGVNQKSLKTGATIFNQNWSQSKTPKGQLTWIVTGDKVTKIFKTGSTNKPSGNSKVIQFVKPSAAARAIKVNSIVSLNHSIPSSAAGYRTTGYLQTAAGQIAIEALNQDLPNPTKALVFDSNWKQPTPQGAVTITISNGAVTEVNTAGSSKQAAANEYVIQIPQSLVASVADFADHTTAQISLDPPNERVRTLSSTHLMSSGFIKVGEDVIPVGAVNFKRLSNTHASVFNHLWLNENGDRFTTEGKATVVVRNGVISEINAYGASKRASATDTVLQIPKIFRNQVLAWTVGTAVEIDLSVQSKNNKKLINALGRGRPNITNGEIVVACDPGDDGVRPRTSIGWDKHGKVWLITGSPTGSNLSNDGYRDGGATVHQMAEWLKQLGATDAVSFDGGGSTWMMRGGTGGARRVDMADPGQYNDPWIRWVPISVGIVDRTD